LLGVNSPPVVPAGITVVSITSSGLFSKAGSTTYSTIDYAIYINTDDIRVYENSSRKGVFSNIFTNGATYKIQRTGSTITYLVNDVVFYTSSTATTVPLYMDTAFFNASCRFGEATMLNAPLTTMPRTATYKIDYNNVNLINKPDITAYKKYQCRQLSLRLVLGAVYLLTR
jgi:hypothetical protein